MRRRGQQQDKTSFGCPKGAATHSPHYRHALTHTHTSCRVFPVCEGPPNSDIYIYIYIYIYDFVFLLDCYGVEDIAVLSQELGKYGPSAARLPQVPRLPAEDCAPAASKQDEPIAIP